MRKGLPVGIWFFFTCVTSLLGMWRVQRLSPVSSNSVACAQCGYNLAGLPVDASCPECGGHDREQKDGRARLKVRSAFERLVFIWTVFTLVPFLWTVGGLFSAPAVLAPAGDQSSGWQNASGGQTGTGSSVLRLIADSAPCAACIVFAAIVWPRRTTWIVGGGLVLLFVARIFGFPLPTEEGLLQQDTPITTLLYLAGVSVSLRVIVFYVESSIVRRRQSFVLGRI